MCAAQSLNDLKEIKKTWVGANGKKIDAILIDADLASFTLKVGPKEMKLTYDKLEPGEASALKVAYLNEQDYLQFEKVKDKLPSIQARSKSVADLLIQIQKDVPDSPYAGLWAVVALSAGMNEHVKAEKWATTVIKCIEAQQAVASSRHETTLCSAYNNLAILQLKAKKGDMAGGAFLHALESNEVIPFVVNHNAQQLLNFIDKDKTLIKLSDKTRTALNKRIATLETAAPGAVSIDGWHYSLDFDIPPDSVAARKVDGVEPPVNGLALAAMGSGFVVAPGVILTSASLIKDMDGIQRKLLSVSARDLEGVIKSYPVQTVYISRAYSRVTSGSTLDLGRDFDKITFTNFQIVEPKAGSVESEICALYVPGLPTRPAVFSPANANMNADITVLGFHRGGDIIQEGVQKWIGATLGAVNETVSRKEPRGTQSMTVAVDGGARGGPVMQANGSVVGMAVGTSESSTGGVLFPVSTIRKWFGEFVKTSDLTYVGPTTATEGLATQTEHATVPIFAWGLPAKSNTALFSKFVDATQIGGMSIVDNWCIACDGDGHMKCPNPDCRKGAIIGKRTVRDGTNPLTGGAIYGEETTSTRCSVCGGKALVDCPHCDGGQLINPDKNSRSRR